MPHRYFSTEITQGRAWLSEADSRHLCVVMRAQAGQAVTVCDGRGTDYACRLAAVSPTRAGLDILSSEACVSEPSVRVILYVGYPKQDKLEHIIQKATELGAARIVPFFSRFCVAGSGAAPHISANAGRGRSGRYRPVLLRKRRRALT